METKFSEANTGIIIFVWLENCPGVFHFAQLLKLEGKINTEQVGPGLWIHTVINSRSDIFQCIAATPPVDTYFRIETTVVGESEQVFSGHIKM